MQKKLENMSMEELLFIRDHGIIDTELVSNVIMDKLKSSLQQKYHYWQATDGRWKVHIYVNGKRKLIAKATEAELLSCLKGIEESEIISTLTFAECFQKFRSLRAETVDVNTLQKYDSEYKRHFAGTDFEKARIVDITVDDILRFVARTIRNPKYRGRRSDHPLAVRAAKQLWYMVYDTFEWAVRNNIIDASHNPCRDIDFRRDFYKITEDNVRSQDKIIVPPEHIKALNEQFQTDHLKDPYYIPTYAVEFASLTGMRAGEIAALRWDHVSNGFICVDSYDSVDKINGTNRIKKRPKNQKVRYIPITSPIQDLLDTVFQLEAEKDWLCDYVFAGENGRFTTGILSSCLKNKCNQAGITPKGINAYRRTVNSLIRANGLSPQAASAVLGNTVWVNNEYYTFDVSSTQEKMDSLTAANDFMLSAGSKPKK